MPASNITGAEAFTKENADRLKGDDYTLKQTFRSKVETKAAALLSSATPVQVTERRATAIDGVPSSGKGKKPAAKSA